MKNTVTPAKNRPTEEQINAWKKKHGKLMQISIKEDDMILILREPGIREIEKATAAARKPGANPFDFNRSLIADCKVYEDEGFFADGKREMTVYGHLDSFKVVKESVVEEL